MNGWTAVRPDRAQSLSDARRQLHHAVQLASAFGISYLPPRGDDSHTNLEWIPGLGVLASNALAMGKKLHIRVAVRIVDLALLVLKSDGVRATCALTGRTIGEAAEWTRAQLKDAGLKDERYSLERHYEIPEHAVAAGGRFDAMPEDLLELAVWVANAASLLDTVRDSAEGASEVRCWPHHFDLATLIAVSPGKTIGAGLEPGDVYYDEPYFYVNTHPQPARDRLTSSLDGGGSWHTDEWVGAVLRGSEMSPESARQQAQASAFFASAIRECRALVA